MLERPPLIITPPPVPSELKSFLIIKNSKQKELSIKCLNLKEIIKNVTQSGQIEQHEEKRRDEIISKTYEYLTLSKVDDNYYSLFNVIFIPLFIVLVTILVFLTVYFVFNR
jgi:hypothetical protein